MDRRSFLKLAAASPALASPVDTRRPDSIAEGYASGTAAGAQPPGFTFHSPLAEAWYRAGDYFDWTSTTPNNEGRRVRVFHRTFGDRANPALVLLHGYPTSSFDFREMIPFLEDDYFVAILDFPGFGFSDKPQDGYSYMLEDDARLVDHFVREIVGLTRFNLLTHDRGGSVGFAFLGNYLALDEKPYEITYHFISNGGLFLPLANLFQGQYDIQHAVRGPELIREQQARPRVTEGTPQQVANADIQAFNDGIGARLYVGKYLLERTANEYRWLDNLRASPIPTALIWGLLDTVNPPRIGNHIWYEYLDKRAVESSYWLLPTAGHYPQRDEPQDGGDRPRLPGGGHPRPRGRERVHAGPGPEPDRDLTRLHGALHHRERPLPGRRRLLAGRVQLLTRVRRAERPVRGGRVFSLVAPCQAGVSLPSVHGGVSPRAATGVLPATMMGPAATSFLPRASTLRFRPSSVRAPSNCRSPGCPNTTSSTVSVPPARTTANPIERTISWPLAMRKRRSFFSGSMPIRSRCS